MAHGQVLADGTAKEVFAQEEVLKKARLQKPYVKNSYDQLAPPRKAADNAANDLPPFPVLGNCRLIQDQYIGVHSKYLGNGCHLPLIKFQIVGIFFLLARQSCQFQRPGCLFLRLFRIHADI